MQILDDGRLTDNKGHTVNFSNTIIIMTSNVGAHLILEKSSNMTEENWEKIYSEMQGEVLGLLRQQLRPEFLNRIDEIIVFHSLTREHIKQIVDLQIELLQKQLSEQGIQIQMTDGAKDFLARVGYDPSFGARPLKRVIQREVVNQLSKEILMGNVAKGQTVEIDFSNNKIQFRTIESEKAEATA